MPRKRTGTCLACANRARVRGLCSACYQVAKYKIRKKQITEHELVQRGLMMPPYVTGQSPFSNLLIDSLSRKRKPPCDENSA